MGLNIETAAPSRFQRDRLVPQSGLSQVNQNICQPCASSDAYGLDGVVTLILGLMIYVQWVSTAAWAIGVLVGVSLVTSGLTRVMLSVAVRKSVTPGRERTKQDDSSAKDYWSVHE
jgi:hypothetical protein